MNTDKEVGECVLNLDLASEPNKHLVKMISNEKSQKVDDEIASDVFLLAMKLKRNKITKQNQPKTKPATKTTPTVTATTSALPTKSGLVVKINFYQNYSYVHGIQFTLDVDTNKTVQELIYQIITKLKVSHTFDINVYLDKELGWGLWVARRLKYKSRPMEGDLAKYNLQNGDDIFYFL